MATDDLVTSCRICAGMCSLRLTRDATGRIAAAHGDKANPLSLPPRGDDGCTHLLAVRRVREVQNTMYRHLEAIRKRLPDNPAWVHPDDLAALGVLSGEAVEIRSAHGCIVARAEADETLRRGVVSITHGFGGESGYKPWRARMSAKFSPAARTRIITSSGPGAGSGFSWTLSTSMSPVPVVTICRIDEY